MALLDIDFDLPPPPVTVIPQIHHHFNKYHRAHIQLDCHSENCIGALLALLAPPPAVPPSRRQRRRH